VATIKINSIKEVKPVHEEYLYSDLTLDLEFGYTKSNELLKLNEVRDLKLSYNYNAIKNSIFNLFNTPKGQKPLNPEFGLNINRYLFNGLSESIAYVIGNDILDNLSRFEPRVKVLNVDVAVDEPKFQYIITLVVVVPNIKKDNKIKLVGTLSNSGFTFTN
jgi:phage baseplate assembly protein W